MNTATKRNIAVTALAAVASSQLTAVGYSATDNVLTVQFPAKPGKPAGVYQYGNFPPEKFDAFQKAESKGSFLIHQIKGTDRNAPPHPFVRLTDDEIAEHITLPAQESEPQAA